MSAVKLGLGKTMPPGYNLVQLDSGHFMWAHDDDIRESAIHWDRWAVYRGAWADYRRTFGELRPKDLQDNSTKEKE